ncbi:MAG: PucR family transcriptional regulator [Propionibacteriaceae bacterium]|jgi:purine catabolism regulator|nr:PucR family transcriptional regulator [Propionibacteriaceae bacterium]
MAFDLKWLLAREELGLELIHPGGPESLAAVVSWVHQSELNDSTLFSEPGEVLITTGSNFSIHNPDKGLCNNYVKRLRDSGVVGLGFGVGVHHDSVPEELVEAAVRHRLPVFTIPYKTPFSAVIKAVSHSRSASEHAFLRQANSAQRRLIAAVGTREPVPSVLQRTAQAIDGWAALITANGGLREITHVVYSGLAEQVASRHRASERSATFERDGSTHLAAYSIASGGVQLGILACGNRSGFDSVATTTCMLSMTLLTALLGMEARLERSLSELRKLAMEALLAGNADLRVLAQLWPSIPAEPLALVCSPSALELGSAIQAEAGGRNWAILEAERFAELEGKLSVPYGAARCPTWVSVGQGKAEAERALAQAELGGQPTVVALLGQAGVALADALLGELTNQPTDLETLQLWLETTSNEETARALGVHRHTVRRRLERIEAMLGAKLTDAAVRNDLYFALRALDVGR